MYVTFSNFHVLSSYLDPSSPREHCVLKNFRFVKYLQIDEGKIDC